MNALAERPKGRTVVAKVEATLPGIPVCGIATYVWQEVNPVEVTMTVAIGFGEPITFHFARDLLDTAFSDPGCFAGRGDVMVKSEANRLLYWLASDHGGRRAIYTSQAKVMDFLAETLAMVPAEQENVDYAVDRAIEQLLGSTS